VLVTSAEPAVGKTTTALNLAIVAAESGRRVILVDADLRGPSIHRLVGTGGTKGLSDVLAGQAALPDVVQRFNGTGFSLIGAGTIPPNPTDLLDSEQMRSLVELLRQEADMVVFDSPPLLLAADSLVLASLSDTVLAVCEPGATHGQALRRARMLLNQIGRNISGVVLNKAPQNPDYGHRYGYY
jgi:receptor protein-tyrosine kinase